MKTASLPALRVDPKLRKAAEDVLTNGETLSSFVEESVRRQIEFRRTQQAFIARGLASSEATKKSGKYISANEVVAKLSARLKQARTKRKTRRTSEAK